MITAVRSPAAMPRTGVRDTAAVTGPPAHGPGRRQREDHRRAEHGPGGTGTEHSGDPGHLCNRPGQGER